MTTRSLFILLIATMIGAPNAFGQYMQQPMNPYASTVSAYPMANPPMGPYGQPPIVQNTAYASNPINDSTTGCGCDACNGNGNCGISHGGCGTYDPCCPTRYLSIFGGASFLDDINYSIDLDDGAGGTLSADAFLETETGWVIGGAIGRSIGRRARIELEFTYRNASVERGELTLGGQPIGGIDLDGSLSMYSFRPNLLFDFCPKSRFNPYVGVGGGAVFQELEVIEPTIPISVNVTNSTFAYQGIAGISSCINPRTEVFMEYRYFGTDAFEVDVGTPIGSASFETDTTSNDVLFGLRIKR